MTPTTLIAECVGLLVASGKYISFPTRPGHVALVSDQNKYDIKNYDLNTLDSIAALLGEREGWLVTVGQRANTAWVASAFKEPTLSGGDTPFPTFHHALTACLLAVLKHEAKGGGDGTG